MSLDGKVALVTGSSRGIGAGIARCLAKRGARVGVHCVRNTSAGQAIVDEIRADGGSATLSQGDVTDEAECRRVVAEVAAAFGGLDILVNNAGAVDRSPLGALTKELFREQFETNTLSVVLMTQEAMKHFPPVGGRVINIASNVGLRAFAGASLYSASKAAVVMLTRCFAKELGARGITVNAVAPGATATDMLNDLPDASMQYVLDNTPLGRIAAPSEIAEVVAFLASDAGGWVTGQTIVADGGFI